MKKTKLFLRKQLLLLAMVCGTTAYAQEYGDKNYYDWFQKSSTGEIIYDEGSQDAWVTTVNQDEWDVAAGGHVQKVDGGFKFGEPDGANWGTVTSLNFDSNAPLTLKLDLSQSNVGAKKSDFLVGFHISYNDKNNNEQNKILYIHVNLKNGFTVNVYDQVVSVVVSGNQQYCVDSNKKRVNPIDHTGILSARQEGEIITIELPVPADYGSNGHTMIDLSAHAGITIGASSNGSATLDIYSEELVLRDDWDNTQRLIQNVGKQLKKVIIVREYTKGWYTLSLPFDLTMKQFQHRFWKSFVKANADSYDWAKESCAEIWHYADFSADTKVMNFRKHDTDEKVLVAGVPYLIYIPEDIKTTLVDFVKEAGVGADVENTDITENDKYKQMVFTNIVLQNPAPSVSKVTDGEASFASNLSKTDIKDVMASNQVYYLSTDAAGENPVLKTPNSESTNIKGFRAYFMTPKGSSTPLAKQSLFFAGDDVVTAINKVDAQPTTNAPVYNMQGLRMNSDLKSLPRGMYIVNGKKYVIK